MEEVTRDEFFNAIYGENLNVHPRLTGSWPYTSHWEDPNRVAYGRSEGGARGEEKRWFLRSDLARKYRGTKKTVNPRRVRRVVKVVRRRRNPDKGWYATFSEDGSRWYAGPMLSEEAHDLAALYTTMGKSRTNFGTTKPAGGRRLAYHPSPDEVRRRLETGGWPAPSTSGGYSHLSSYRKAKANPVRRRRNPESLPALSSWERDKHRTDQYQGYYYDVPGVKDSNGFQLRLSIAAHQWKEGRKTVTGWYAGANTEDIAFRLSSPQAAYHAIQDWFSRRG